MEAVIKYPAQQSLFNATNNLVDLIIPGSSGIYDLSQSFVSILTRLSPTKSTVDLIAGSGTDDGVYDVRLHFKHQLGAATVANKGNYDNTATPIECLVSSCSMMSAAKGTVEDIRRSDVLRGTLSVYQKDLDSRQAEALTTWAGAAKDCPWSHGQYVNLNGEGSLRSQEITHEIRLPLRDLFDAGHFTAWDSSVYGDTRIHLELNLGQVLATQCQGLADPTWVAAYQSRALAGGTAANLPEFGYRTAMMVAATAAGAPRSHQLVVPAASTPAIVIQNLTMMTEYDSLEDCPFWVGQDVTIQCFNVDPASSTGGRLGLGMTFPVAENISGQAAPAPGIANGSGSARRAIINEIEYDKATRLVKLKFGGTVVEVAIQQGTGTGTHGGTLEVHVTGSDTAGSEADTTATTYGNAAPISYESVELVATLRTDIAPGQAPKEHQYSHFVNQADTFSNTTNMQRTYQIPPNCTAVVIAVLNTDPKHSSFLGSAEVTDYRFTIDGEQVTNRPVPYESIGTTNFKNIAGGSLHYDLVQKTFLNIGKNARYQSLKEGVYDQLLPVGLGGNQLDGKGFDDATLSPLKRAFLLCTPIPQKSEPSQLLLEMGGTFPGGANLQIYSYITSGI